MSEPQTLDQVETSLSEAALFLKALYENSPGELYLEIRVVPTRLLAGQNRFFRLRQLQRRGFDQAVPINLDGLGNPYVGAVPRIESGRYGDSNTDHFGRVWADYDVPDHPVAWPAESSVEWASSPGINPAKRQAVWLLDRPVSRSECVSLNLRMAQATGADPSRRAPPLPQ